LEFYTEVTADGHVDTLSPDERARVVREHIVTDLDSSPTTFRQRVEANGSESVGYPLHWA
jgi:hypothetical protein